MKRKIKFNTPLWCFIQWADKRLKEDAHKVLTFAEAIDKAEEFYKIETTILKQVKLGIAAQVFSITIPATKKASQVNKKNKSK